MSITRMHSIPVLLVLVGCASTPPASSPKYEGPEIRSIAIVRGDPLAEAVGVELFNRGLRTTEITADEAADPTRLATEGIDAVLTVRSQAGHDSLPESATVRLVSTKTHDTVAAMNWANSHLGAAGSPADRMVRNTTAEAASKIATDLLRKLK